MANLGNPSLLKGPKANLTNFCLGGGHYHYYSEQQKVVLLLYLCLLCKHSWKDSLDENVVRTLIHKTCRYEKDPWETVSQ